MRFLLKNNNCSESLLQPTKSIVIVVQKGERNSRSWLVIRLRDSKYFWSWNNEWIKKAVSDGKREEQPNMDGNVLARRIVCIAVRERATNSSLVKANTFFFLRNVYWLHSICCAICADRDGYSRVCVFPAGFGSNFRIMVGSASGPGSTFKAFLGSTRVRVPLSNKIRVRVGSAQHIYGSLRVRVRIFGPVKTSTLSPA